MSILGDFFKPKQNAEVPQVDTVVDTVPETKSGFNSGNLSYGQPYRVINKVWDGEKTLGNLGTVVRNIPDFQRLRLRSYDAYAKSDAVKIISSKFFYWVIGSGLKLQAEPNRDVLESEGITEVDFNKFQKVAEARFMIYANSTNPDYAKQKNLHDLALDFFKGTWLGGDTLCIARFDKNGPTAQFVSGEHLATPYHDAALLKAVKERGNTIEHGIELNNKGVHIAYFVLTKSKDDPMGKFERIQAIGEKSKRKMAWMIYGQKISPDHVRAVPAISQALEKIAKLDRYTESAVSKAEQAAKIVYTINHKEFSTGENPLDNVVAKKLGTTTTNPADATALGDGLANRITETTENQTYNLPQGAEFKSFGTDIETDFSSFHGSVFNIISASMDVPPEVAMQMYNSNYSASRAAINAWGYVVDINRNKFANDFYIPFYKLWLEFEILNNKIDAPSYINAVRSGNFMITESYSQCRFTGKNMPHIDPLKEIKAIRAALGEEGEDALISREQATEALGYGQWDKNFLKNLEEEKIIPEPKKEEEEKENVILNKK